MRALVLLLLLVNVGYFASERYFAPSPAPHESAGQRNPERGIDSPLRLLSELRSREPGGQAVATKVADSIPARPAPSVSDLEADSCVRIDGIEKKTEADVLAAALQHRGAQLVGRGAKQTARRNYWVMLPSFASRQQAQSAVRALERSGLSDFYLIRSGDHANAVSLGVFSSEQAAKRRLRQVSALDLPGRPPQLDFLELTAKRYWVAVRWADSAEPEHWRGALPAGPGVAVSAVACGAAR